VLRYPECGMTTFVNLRITFGDVAKEGEFPWLAALFYVNKWGDSINLCGGALISPLHVVTAAHCLGILSSKSDHLILKQTREYVSFFDSFEERGRIAKQL